MSKRGRPAILNEKKRSEILAILSTGCGRQTAANYVNCDPKTIYNTAQRDPTFADQLARIESTPEINHLRNVHLAGKEQRYWRASAWALERLFPEKYGLRDPDTITTKQFNDLMSGIVAMLIEEIPVARYRKQVLARLKVMLTGKESSPDRKAIPHQTSSPTETDSIAGEVSPESRSSSDESAGEGQGSSAP